MSVQRHWHEEAERWARWAREPGNDTYWRFHRDAFFELVPREPCRALDLGCGEGRVARDLAALGHEVKAIDASAAMVEQARAAGGDVEVFHADAATMPFADRSFDLVIAFMSLMNVDDLDGALTETGRVLEDDGVVCIAITHPLATAGSFVAEEAAAPFVIEGSYFEERTKTHLAGSGELSVAIADRHRPLGTYTEALATTGFLLDAVREIPTGDEPEPDEPRARWRRIPMFLHLRARRQGRP